MESDGVSMSWNTTDCDVPEAAKGSFEAATGGLVFTQQQPACQRNTSG